MFSTTDHSVTAALQTPGFSAISSAGTQGNNFVQNTSTTVNLGSAGETVSQASSIGAGGLMQTQTHEMHLFGLGSANTQTTCFDASGYSHSQTQNTDILGVHISENQQFGVSASGLEASDTINGTTIWSIDGFDVGCCGCNYDLCTPCNFLGGLLPSFGNTDVGNTIGDAFNSVQNAAGAIETDAVAEVGQTCCDILNCVLSLVPS
jgi:hypothetical protein